MYTFKNNELKISVRNLVEFICREGDIDNRRGQGSDKNAMEAGRKAHQKIQKSMGSQYEAEVAMKMEFPMENYSIVLEGRADGVITEDELVTIDEIKGTYAELRFLEKPIAVHRAQALCYAYMKCVFDNLDRIGLMMTYVNLDTEEVKYFREVLSFEEVSGWFEDVIRSFKRFSDFIYFQRLKRQASIKPLAFPFEYREGQKNLAVSVYKTISLNSTLFIQAPTGVGKTISCIYPAVKSVGEGMADKIFYLTAKNITGTVAEETYRILRQNGLEFKTLTITAKEKVCLNEECNCNPATCPYAEGHFNRINDAVYDIITHEEGIGRDVITEYAKKHKVCPFEFSLDVSYWADGIICDYNYVFDPNVYLKRYFSDGVPGDYVFLVDEAHNMVDRARDMYSAVLYKDKLLEIRRLVEHVDKRLFNSLTRCNKEMLVLKRECETYMVHESLGALELSLTRLFDELSRFLEEKKEFEFGAEVADLFFDVRHFLNMRDLADENYILYSEHTEDGFMVKLFCVNPAKNISLCTGKGKGTIFFSATLLPITYYKELLGDKDDYAIYAHSPFDTKKRLLMIAGDVTSRYSKRNETEFLKVKNYIDTIVSARKGNYLIFFPSYGYMEKIYELYDESDPLFERILVQSKGMNEAQREDFLNNFENMEKGCVGFCVIGGVFSEGIDLKHESLIGCVVVGTGIPQICTERQLLRDFYDNKDNMGYEYSYTYPGMNKVMQAAGRVIRTDEDYGVIALLDDRFLRSEYRRMFPLEWNDNVTVNRSNVSEVTSEFWRNVQGVSEEK